MDIEQDHEPVILEIADGVGTITLNRPRQRNAIGVELVEAFADRVAAMHAADVRLALLRSRGPVFCAGADLRESPARAEALVDRLLDLIADDRIFWIAEVQGGCVGAGVAVALTCPAVYASTEAWFWTPELSRIGRLPVPVIRRLGPVLGLRTALSLSVTQERVAAGRAYQQGWVTWVGPPEELANAAADARAGLAAADAASLAAAVGLWPAVRPSRTD